MNETLTEAQTIAKREFGEHAVVYEIRFKLTSPEKRIKYSVCLKNDEDEYYLTFLGEDFTLTGAIKKARKNFNKQLLP